MNKPILIVHVQGIGKHVLASSLLQTQLLHLFIGSLIIAIFIGPKSEHCLALSLSHSLRHSWLWDLTDVTLTCEDSRNRSTSHTTSPCLTSCCQFWQTCCQCWNITKALLLMTRQNKSHVVDAGTKQKPCCWCRNKTIHMLLMPEQNESRVADVGTKQKTIMVKKWSDQFSRHFIPISKQMSFRKTSKRGDRFQSKNLCCRFWTFT